MDYKYHLIAISDDRLTEVEVEDYSIAFKSIFEYASMGIYDEVIIYRLIDGVVCLRWKNYERGDE